MPTLRVNGVEHPIRTHPRASLLWALRDELSCSSVKYGCGAGHCGSCRVVIDGAPTSSCLVTVEDAAGADIRTLEGYVADGRAAPIVNALLEVNAGQCGYCIPGIVTTLVSVGERSPTNPSRDDVLRALDDHLCRCGSQPRITAAALAALPVDE